MLRRPACLRTVDDAKACIEVLESLVLATLALKHAMTWTLDAGGIRARTKMAH